MKARASFVLVPDTATHENNAALHLKIRSRYSE
jgi:hypothetical protein